MESKARIAIKALTWQLLGLAVMIVIGFIFTGSVRAGGRHRDRQHRDRLSVLFRA